MRSTTRVTRRQGSSDTQSGSDERGFVLVWFALLIFVMLGVTAFAVDLGHAYFVAQQSQDAADAAALSSASYLPDNCVNANDHAQSIAALNGFTNGVAATTVTAVNGSSGGTGCNNDPTLSPNEIRVQVKRKIDTWFARAIGISTITVSRTSVAEYDPPVALGSPASYFGNLVGCSTCDQPDIWASIQGRGNRKVDGNAIYSGWCANSTDRDDGPAADNCPGTGLSNSDRDTEGMLFQIKNPNLESLNLELFDPGYVDDGQFCAGSHAVYPVCTGDRVVTVAGPTPPTQTTYTVYPLDNLTNPLGHSAICSVTYPGYTSYAGMLAANPADLTRRSFHQWANLGADARCPALTGSSYVLQVQSGDGRGLATEAGANNFSIAACSGCMQNQPAPDPNVSISAITKMSLYTNAPAGTVNPKFYLARVPSWAKGQTLSLTFFDIGDIGGDNGSVPGALTVAAIDATHGSGGPLVGEFSGCTYSHPATRTNYIDGANKPWDFGLPQESWARGPSTLTGMGGGCTAQVTVSNRVATWNGKWVSWQIKIPGDYTCNDRDQTKCWLQIRYAYANANAEFHDATTWTASLSGNPVRLTK